VKECDGAIELCLNGGFAGDGKGDGSEFFGCRVVVFFLGGGEGAEE
jgi:hypothetical protein